MLVPYTIESGQDGRWFTRARLGPGIVAHGRGDTPDAALADLREAFDLLAEELGTSLEPM